MANVEKGDKSSDRTDRQTAINKLKLAVTLAAGLADHTSNFSSPNRLSSVLIVLRYVESEGSDCWDVLLTVRSKHLRFQPGQVCLPGGKVEPGEDIVSCALREANEEVHLESSALEIIGTLPPINSLGHTVVCPVLSILKSDSVDLFGNPDEVQDIFWMPLVRFLHSEIHRTGSHLVESLHYFDYCSPGTGHIYTVWGLTSRVLMLTSVLAYHRLPEFNLIPSSQSKAKDSENPYRTIVDYISVFNSMMSKL